MGRSFLAGTSPFDDCLTECEDRSCAQREEREVEEDRQGYVYLVRRLGVGRLRRGGVVSCERIGVDHPRRRGSRP